MEIAISEWLRLQEPDFCGDGIFKLVPRWDKYINALGDNSEKSNDTSVEYMDVCLTLVNCILIYVTYEPYLLRILRTAW
jgi:hypothetical protein